MRWVMAMIAVLWILQTGAFAVAQDEGAQVAKNPRVEWFSIKGVGGLYGGGVGIDAFTLRWKWVVWDLVHAYPFVAGAHSYQKPHDNGHMAWLMVAGTRVGVPIALESSGRHELRPALGLLAGVMKYGSGTAWSAPEDDGLVSHASFGPHVEVSLSYVYRLYEHLAFELGLSLMVATRSDIVFMVVSGNTSETTHNLPWPVVQSYAGLRF